MLGPCVNCFNALILMVKIHIHIAHVFLSQVDPIQMQMLSFRSNVSLSALIFSDLASTGRERRMTWRALVLSVYLNWAFRLIHFHRPSPARKFVPLVKKGFLFLEAGAPSFQNACWKVSGKHTKLMLLTKNLSYIIALFIVQQSKVHEDWDQLSFWGLHLIWNMLWNQKRSVSRTGVEWN